MPSKPVTTTHLVSDLLSATKHDPARDVIAAGLIANLIEALKFYAEPGDFLYFENRFLEYGDRNIHLQATNTIGCRARIALAEADEVMK